MCLLVGLRVKNLGLDLDIPFLVCLDPIVGVGVATILGVDVVLMQNGVMVGWQLSECLPTKFVLHDELRDVQFRTRHPALSALDKICEQSRQARDAHRD